jgi:hypothetical protein
LGPEDHPETDLSNQNLRFVVKISIGRHKVTKTLVDNGASLNLVMRKTFIEMGLNLTDVTPVHYMFHDVILGLSYTPIGRIDLEVFCGSGENKCSEMLTFKVTSFDIGYNCILRRHFLLKFMVVIYIVYATMKMPGPKGVITIKADQRDGLACENASLSHVGSFNDKTTQEQIAKGAKTQGGSTPLKTSRPKPQTDGTLSLL